MKRKIICLLLAVCMLATGMVIFSSCTQQDGEVTVSKKSVEVDLSEYALVYPDKTKEGTYSQTFQGNMDEFALAINSATGLKLRALAEKKTKSDPDSPEILVGLTTREESQKAYDSIKDHGYTIKVIGNKIVIVGTTPLLTLKAVSYFKENYLTGDGRSAIINVNKEATAEQVEMITLADSQKGYYTFIYGADYDKDALTDVSYDTTPDGTTTMTRFVYDMLRTSVEQIAQAVSLKSSKTLPLKTDAEALADHEVAVGMTNRPVTKKLLERLAVDECGIYIEDGNIAVGAWNMTTIDAAQEMFLDYLTESVVTEGDASSIMVPKDLYLSTKVSHNWQTDFPKPEGVQLYNTAGLADDGLEYLYMGEGVNAAAYKTYCNALKAEGYRMTGENEIEDSYFAFFVNDAKAISLYVAYNAFKYAGENDYAYAQPSLRIVAHSLKGAMLPPAEMLSQQSWQKKTDSAITATGLPSESSGEGYIITLEDGRFLVIDGGDTLKGTEVENFRKALWDLHARNSGKPVSVDNPVRIAAWILTHSHGDHYKLFVDLLRQKGKSGELFVEYMIGNFPIESQLFNITADFTAIDKMNSYQSMLTEPFTFVRVHTGQKLYIGNVEIETLYTHEDMNPHNIVTFNDSSSVMRLTINVTGGDPVKLLSTGDAFRYAGRWCSAMYGPALQTEMVTMAHHGGPAVEKEFYTYVAPSVIWWPHNTKVIHDKYLKNNDWYALVDQHAYNLPSVEYVYCSGDDHNITLYLRADGPAYDELYNAGFGNALTYDDYHIIEK